MPTLYGQFASFQEWAEIDSIAEGHYLERMAPSVFENSIAEDRDRIRCLYHHGLDPFFGTAPLGPIRSLEPDTSYEVDLIDTDYNKRLLPMLESGELGASFRFRVIRDELERRPSRSADNPARLPQVTVTEAKLIEFGPTPLPAYKGATAGVRSTREVVVELSNSAHRLGPGERWAIRSKPLAPGVLERQRVRGDQLPYWEKDRPSWLLRENPPSWLLRPRTDPDRWFLA
jgi:phage head maturation protease